MRHRNQISAPKTASIHLLHPPKSLGNIVSLFIIQYELNWHDHHATLPLRNSTQKSSHHLFITSAKRDMFGLCGVKCAQSSQRQEEEMAKSISTHRNDWANAIASKQHQVLHKNYTKLQKDTGARVLRKYNPSERGGALGFGIDDHHFEHNRRADQVSVMRMTISILSRQFHSIMKPPTN